MRALLLPRVLRAAAACGSGLLQPLGANALTVGATSSSSGVCSSQAVLTAQQVQVQVRVCTRCSSPLVAAARARRYGHSALARRPPACCPSARTRWSSSTTQARRTRSSRSSRRACAEGGSTQAAASPACPRNGSLQTSSPTNSKGAGSWQLRVAGRPRCNKLHRPHLPLPREEAPEQRAPCRHTTLSGQRCGALLRCTLLRTEPAVLPAHTRSSRCSLVHARHGRRASLAQTACGGGACVRGCAGMPRATSCPTAAARW